MKKNAILVAMLLLSIQIKVSALAEQEYDNSPVTELAYQTAYGNILWQYFDAWSTEYDVFADQEPESIINYLVFRGMIEAELKYSLYDIDKNGIPELLIGTGESDYLSVLDIFTYSDDTVVHLLDGGERWYLTLYKDGIIGEYGSGGAAYSIQRYFTIGEDGTSCITELYYDINGDNRTVEDIDGNLLPLEDVENRYLDIFEKIELDWTTISESGLLATFGEQDVCGSKLTKYEVLEAPQLKKGICENSTELLLDAYRRISEGNEYSTYSVSRDYYEENEKQDVFFVEEPETNYPISTIYVDLQTGEAKEVFKGGEIRSFSIFSIDTSEETEIASEEPMESDIRVQFEHVYEESTEFAVITAVDRSGAVIWTYYSGKYNAAQLMRVSEIGIYGERYYFCEDSSVAAVDIYTGNIIWRSDKICGSPSAHLWDSNGTLYLCGGLGPDLVMISTEGEVLGYVNSFYEKAYWPYGIKLCEYDRLEIAYGGGSDEFLAGGVLQIDLNTLEAINIPEVSEEEPEIEANYFQVVNCSEYITLRAEPSTSAMELDRISLGEMVEVLEYAGNDFYRIIYNGQIGYALSYYLQPY